MLLREGERSVKILKATPSIILPSKRVSLSFQVREFMREKVVCNMYIVNCIIIMILCTQLQNIHRDACRRNTYSYIQSVQMCVSFLVLQESNAKLGLNLKFGKGLRLHDLYSLESGNVLFL